ncbi:uroporphyrinogen-III synthase [Paenibacillus xerothermodurans]|uniref:Uroporphyrinogen-III synthase n=1 Tax=Paenibacillus xerothermodurans TaxID=1977292 RepID=A0A2W1N7S3_PAEXE|nr:uroporphyrinogen-III synthase [Paenibacillus xerothermodurans]PZE20417.1 uroporphyrinogen-III synthase [Paenibacillus xerothermodurans]
MRRLEGKRIALTGPRKAAELSVIVEKLGGIPLLRPAQGTVAVERPQLEAEIRQFLDHGADWIILTTGIGTEMLYEAAAGLDAADVFVERLKQTKIAARGYKTVRYLKSLGLTPTVRDDDGTTRGILRALQPYDLRECRVALQLYGDHAPQLVAWLKQQQADYYEILPYQHVPPELEVLDMLLSEIIGGQVDAVTFTSTPQVRFMMSYARRQGKADQLLAAFQSGTVAVAVGKVTAEALWDEGVERVVAPAPDEERMGSMIVALAKYYESQSPA